MKKITTILLLTVALTAFVKAEEKPSVTVVGTSEIKVTPDITVLSLSVYEIKPQMGDAIKALSNKSAEYVKTLKKLGFEEKDIKTTGFSVQKHRVYRHNEYVDSGYYASHQLLIEFPYSQEMMQKILIEFSKADKPVDFTFSFKLSDKLNHQSQQLAIDSAVKDASYKAAGIAKTAGVKLLKIQEIEYGHVQTATPYAERAMMFKSNMAADNMQSFNFTPDDVTLTESVTIEWLME